MNARGMQGLTASRISSEEITLEYEECTELDDGSATVAPELVPLKASVGILQPKEIERFEKAGIIIRNGITIVARRCPEVQPDKVWYGGKGYRVINWSFVSEYVESGEAFGTVIAICDEISINGAESQGSGE